MVDLTKKMVNSLSEKSAILLEESYEIGLICTQTSKLHRRRD